jgi:hypothetical protein
MRAGLLRAARNAFDVGSSFSAGSENRHRPRFLREARSTARRAAFRSSPHPAERSRNGDEAAPKPAGGNAGDCEDTKHRLT